MANLVASVMFIMCFMAITDISKGVTLIDTVSRCECAGFNSEDVDETDKPILIQNPINTTCDAAGELICKTICLDLAKLSKGKGPEILCSHLKHATDIQPSMFTRVCGNDWKYSGITLPDPICCHDGEVVECPAED